MNKTLTALLLIMTTVPTWAVISGYIYYEENDSAKKEPLIGAGLYISEEGNVALAATEDDGKFEIKEPLSIRGTVLH